MEGKLIKMQIQRQYPVARASSASLDNSMTVSE